MRSQEVNCNRIGVKACQPGLRVLIKLTSLLALFTYLPGDEIRSDLDDT